MKAIVLSIMVCTTLFAQQQAETDPWLIDPAYITNSVYSLKTGRNPYEAFLRSLSGLAEKLRAIGSDIQIDAPVAISAATTYSFGNVHISYHGTSTNSRMKKSDSLDVQSNVSFFVSLLYNDETKWCSMNIGNDVIEKKTDETFSISHYGSRVNSTQTLSYEFRGMTFSDLLAELEQQGITIHFKTDGDVTYSLSIFPLSKVKQ